jgi:hypothetical protein
MNKALKIAIGVATIGILGTAGYFIYQAIKRNRDGEGDGDADGGGGEQAPAVDPPAVVEGGSANPTDKTPFKNKAQGNLFREWVNKFYNSYAKSNNLGVSGEIDNSSMRKAWSKYGATYKKGSPNFLKVKGNAIPENLLKAYNTKKDKSVLGSNSSGDVYLRTINLGKILGKDTYAYFYGSGKVNFISGGKSIGVGNWWDNGKKIKWYDGTIIEKDNFYNTAYNIFSARAIQISVSNDWSLFTKSNNVPLDGNLQGDLDSPARRGLGLDMNIID